MHLKALRLRGFKSFAHGVELRFEPGIAVVVGPNGSGKSNIADGLQWAMAAQSPAQLRAPTGQDVLFSGTDSRPPAGICEVELVLDNECETLPLEFGEVSVMRRLYRDGESEYFVNRARVRRLDVLELLSDTGLGREMHSVIGQGKVEEILLSKPHERRRFVEEAAGLGKYQRRRSRAESKLTRVASELERARDLEREVKARLRPLAMQATAADRAAKLAAEIASGRILLLSSELLNERRQVGELRARHETAAAGSGGVEREVAEISARRSRAEEELTGLASAQERAARAFYAFETVRGQVAERRERIERAATGLERSAGRHEADADRLERDAGRMRAEALEADGAAEQHAAEAAKLTTGDAGAADEAAAAAEAELAVALDAKRALAETEGRAATIRRDAEAAAGRVAELEARLVTLRDEGPVSGETVREADAQARAVQSDLEQSRETLEQATAAGVETEAAAEAARSRAGEARLAAGKASQELDLTRDRLRSLEQALERGDGLPPAARALREAGRRLVISGVVAEPGYERAVAAALGWRAGAVIAEHLESGLELLAEGDGELAVVVGGRREASGASLPSPGARPLAEVATVTDPDLAWLVDGVWLVDDLSVVSAGVAVTVEGAGYDAERGELWRTGDAGEAALLAARAERDRAEAAVGRLESEAKVLAEHAERADADAGKAAADEQEARGLLREARRLESELSEAARAAAGRRDQMADQLARADAARDLAERDLEVEKAKIAELAGTAAAVDTELAERRERARAADERHAALELTRRRLAEEAARLAAQVAALGEREARARQDAKRLRDGAETAAGGAARCRQMAAEARELAPAAAGVLDQLAEVSEAALALAEPARAGVAAIEQRATSLAAELNECATAEAEARGRAREAAAAVTEVEVSLARCEERMSELGRRRAEIAASNQLEVSELEEPLSVDDAAATAARLERLERRRASLGAVNPLAQEEYESEKERADDLTRQCDDLEKSLAELRKLIRDLTATIDQRFAATFDSVAKNFAEVISTLFPGGRGRLRLTEPEVVSAAPVEGEDAEDAQDAAEHAAGIELEVRPAGKKIDSLSLLSGGEKSLTAIAFLFSLLLTKPSPFYVLDEVEAALDDANIDRFLELLRAYQDKAQFIVITHQRRTMEVADVLYGVTMAGDGESKVLSRRMPSEPSLHEAALESA
jgi:chromosome segregation protein